MMIDSILIMYIVYFLLQQLLLIIAGKFVEFSAVVNGDPTVMFWQIFCVTVRYDWLRAIGSV